MQQVSLAVQLFKMIQNCRWRRVVAAAMIVSDEINARCRLLELRCGYAGSLTWSRAARRLAQDAAPQPAAQVKGKAETMVVLGSATPVPLASRRARWRFCR